MKHVSQSLFALLFALALNLCFAPSARAAITVSNYWRMAETETPGNGTVLSSTADIVGGKTLILPGGPIARAEVSSAASNSVGSTFMLWFFTSGVYGTNNGLISSAVNNFGIELWVKPNDTTGNKCLAYNGDTGFSGWGIYQIGATYQALFGNVAFFGSGTATAGTWTHLALVRNNGTATLYVNGVAAGSTTTSAPNNPTGIFGVAAKPTDTTQDRFVGYLDEIRVFTFTAGQFTTNDLLLNAGPPTATSSAAGNITGSGATLNGSVNPHGLATSYYFKYGTNISYGSTSATGTLPVALTNSAVNVAISNLSVVTLYHFQIIAANSAGIATGGDLTFTTTAAAPSATTQPATSLTTTGATLNASINPNGAATSFYFQYGLTASYGSFSSTNSLAAGTVLVSTNRTITGLSPGTLYHFRVVASNSVGTTNAGDLTFTTAAVAPTATTQPSTFLTSTGATMNATINPGGAATTAWFEWGIGSVYGQQTTPTSVGAGSSSVAFTNQLTNLTAGLAYHCRVVASNSVGVVRGRDVRFWSPVLTLIGANPFTNALNTPFVDPGASVTASPRALAGGAVHSLGSRADGVVLGWGRNNFGQTNVPPNTTNAVAVAGGDMHSLALRADGTMVAWGANGINQTNIPVNATNAIAISAGDTHNLALRADATAVGWGNNSFGQGSIPASVTNVVSIAAGGLHSLAARADGTVVAWGYNTAGQTNVPASATNVIAVAASQSWSLALRANGTAVGWGLNGDGQTNIPPSASNVVAIAAGRTHGLALRSNGTLVAWGSGVSGQTNIPSGATNIVAIAAGGYHNLALRADGAVFGWGDDTYGATNIPSGLSNPALPVTVSGSVNTSVPGTYQLTYSTTNSLGAVATTTRTVVVPGVTAPSATTQPATAVTNTAATLNATINPNSAATTYYFQYGLTAAYGSFSSTNSLPATNSLISTNRTITGLAPGTLYHFRVVATNSAGAAQGADLTFTTVPIAVQNLDDSGPGSLREAILTANTNSGPSVISATNISGTISLASPLPFITNSITINGPGMTHLTISGGGTNRVFFVDAPGAAVSINNLTIANGRAKGGKGGAGYGGGGGLGAGGALFANAGAVTLVSVGFSNNAAIGGAGGDTAVDTAGPWGSGGGGFGGDGGNGAPSGSGGGGGGFGGRGGDGVFQGAGTGGGGRIGNGGAGGLNAGSGGGAIGDGQPPSGNTGGTGGAGGGGNGGDNTGFGDSSGQGGQTNGGGGGGGHGIVSGYFGGNGGPGGKFGGGGGAKAAGNGGAGGDFGGGGGATTTGGLPPSYANGGSGGFGGGGGGAFGSGSGAGGFGGGSGANTDNPRLGSPGAFGGSGGSDSQLRGSGGGGGAALGGALFVRGNNGASLTLVDAVPDDATLTPGSAGSIWYDCSGAGVSCATSGSVAGSAMFLLGGTNTVSINSGSKTITGSIGGWNGTPTTFVKNGAGILVLAATNTYAGGTIVNAGTLRVDGSIATSSNITVNSSATLAGAGPVGNLTINTGATLSPGASPGTMTASNTVWSGAANYNWQLYDAANASGIGSDLLQVNGSLDVSGASGFKINLWTLSATGPDVNGNALNFNNTQSRSWTIVQTTAGIVGFNAANFIINIAATNGTGGFANSLGAGGFTLSVVGNKLVLTFVAPLSATTLPATAVASTSATLNGSVNASAQTTAYFQYGLTTNYGGFSSTQNVSHVDGGLNFNGVNQSASLTSVNGLATGPTAHTIEAWLKPTLAPANREWVLLLGDPGPGSHHWLLQPNGEAQIGVYGGNQVNPVLQPNVWTHLAATYDGTDLSVYTNGVLAGTTAASFNLAGVSLKLAQDVIGESYYGGAMDEVRIWNVARTAAEIQAAYNTTLTGNESGLLAYFRMDEGAGSTLNDTSGHTNNLVTAGSPAWINEAPSTVSRTIAGLTPGTTYHYRCVASSSLGTVFGNDMTFTTTGGQATSPLLTSPTMPGNGSFQFDFTNTPGANFSVLASTNVGLPLSNWTVLSNVVESPAGQFRFTDPQATNGGQRFYRVRSP